MAWRFRKRISLGKFIKLNISKSGVSTTIGVKGASVNIGKKGIYRNLGIPGTGIYSREKINTGSPVMKQPSIQTTGTGNYDYYYNLCLKNFTEFKKTADDYLAAGLDDYRTIFYPLLNAYQGKVMTCPNCHNAIVPVKRTKTNSGIIFLGLLLMLTGVVLMGITYTLIGFFGIIAGIVVLCFSGSKYMLCMNCYNNIK